MDDMLESLRIGDENAGLGHVVKTIHVAECEARWPSTALWRATWLNMYRLVYVLLERRMILDSDDSASCYFPSPLYVASQLGLTRLTRTFLKNNANSKVLRDGVFGALWTAAAHGNPNTARSLWKRKPKWLELPAPESLDTQTRSEFS